MTVKDRAIVVRWKPLLAGRRILFRRAKAAEHKRSTAASRELLARRVAQVKQAERVIARHTTGGAHLAAPCVPLLGHAWGYHPGVHDGVDLITEGDDIVYAICDGVIVDARSSGWWGKGAHASSGHPISDGDGIIQLRCTVNAGPFRKGMVFGYGHSEKAVVRVGQSVKAGEKIGHAGFANAWHEHFMVNAGNKRRGDGGYSGVGDRDPWPFVDYATKHS